MSATTLTPELFNDLFRRYRPRLQLIARSIVRDAAVAEDMVHESFMTVWEQRGEVEYTNIEAYLYRVVRNNCLRWRRDRETGRAVYERIQQQERRVMEYFTRAIEGSDPDQLFQTEIREIVQAELERMPDETRRIFLAHRVEGLSYKEIADRFGVSVKRVDKALQSAALRLRRSLKDYLPLLIMIRILLGGGGPAE